jgi:farnesyl-diphosphate farnesyltransferase
MDALWKMLREVSRSFYLTLRVLPPEVRPQVGIAYLLARLTDTIADTHLVSAGRRRAALREMRTAILASCDDRRAPAPDFDELAGAQPADGRGSAAERRLLEAAGEIVDALQSFAPQDRQCIRDLLQVITLGQESDLDRFGAADAAHMGALESDHDLQEYTYAVAGCVGEFWTKICRAHLFPKAELDDTILLARGILFGKGLQLVNILRDLPEDLRRGRCYIPRLSLAEIGLKPESLLNPGEMGCFRPLYDGYLAQARELLAAGRAYTDALPRNQRRVRLACAWPVLIGLKTIARLRTANVLDQRNRIKVRRAEVYWMVMRSLILYPGPRSWNRLFDRAGAG